MKRNCNKHTILSSLYKTVLISVLLQLNPPIWATLSDDFLTTRKTDRVDTSGDHTDQNQDKETHYYLHGIKIDDKYLWMENARSGKLQEWVHKQNYTARRFLDNLAERKWLIQQFQNPVRDEQSIMMETSQSKRLFYWKKKAGETYAAFYTRPNISAPEELLINPNKWKNNHYITLCSPSPNGRYIVFVETIGGEAYGEAKIMEVKSKKILSEKLMGPWQGFYDWDGDSQGFYYCATGLNSQKSPNKDKNYWLSVYHHQIEAPGTEDEKVFYDDNHKEYRHSAVLSEDKKYLILYRWQSNRINEAFVRKTNPGSPVQSVATGMDAYYNINVYNHKLFIQTNDKAPNGKVFVTDVNRPQKAYWKTFFPEQHATLQKITFANHHIYAVYLKNAHTQVKIYDFNGKFISDLPLPGLGTASVSGVWLKGPVYITYESFLYPQATYTYNLIENKLSLVQEDACTRFCDISDLEVKQVWYRSKDNTPISMFLMCRKKSAENSNHPAILVGYGGFNHAITPGFNGYYYHLVKHGVIVAWPNLRGGGEYGEKWHQAGMQNKKQNTVDDYISAAEWLIANHYTKPNCLAALGGSNGGLTVAAAMVQRPDLFRAVVCDGALLDMLRYHRFDYAETWKKEYGISENKEQFDYLIKYSPYYNVKTNTRYPDILFVVGANDPTVSPVHSFKMTAKMQEKNERNAVMLAVYNDIGHQGGNIDKVVNKAIDTYAFILNRLNIEKEKNSGH